MPVFTPNFSLPVPGPLDAPCDFAEQWCAFTDATQVVLDEFQAIADRTNPVVPLAKLEMRETVVVQETSTIPFDTLTLNNANMVDFDTSNSSIIIKRPGRFFFVLNVLIVASATPNIYFQVQYHPAGAGTINRTPANETNFSAGGAINVGTCASAVFHVTTPPENVRVTIQSIGVDENIRMDLAALSVFWFADRGTP